MFRIKVFFRRSLRLILAFFAGVLDFWRRFRFHLFVTVTSLVTLSNCVTSTNADPENRAGIITPSIVRIMADGNTRIGTGFKFDYEGKSYIGTAAHVCQTVLATGKQPSVYHYDGKLFQEKVVKYGYDIDACILTDSGSNSPSLRLNADLVPFASHAYTFGYSGAMGYTYGKGEVGIKYPSLWPSTLTNIQDLEFCNSQSKAIQINLKGNPFCYYEAVFLATNILVYGGQSGSPLLNSHHQVIGVLSMTTANGSLWVPMDDFTQLLRDIKK